MQANPSHSRRPLSTPRSRRKLGIGGGPHTAFALIWGLGVAELLVILVILVIMFGAKRIPEIARGIGGGIRTFKNELKDGEGSGDRDHHLPPGDGGAPRD